MTPSRRGNSLWINRDFGLLWGGQSVSQFGSAITLLVLPLVAIEKLHASILEVSVLSALAGLPFLLFGLPAGALIEGRSLRRVMLGSDAVRSLALLAVPLAIWAGVLTLGILYAVVLVTATSAIFFDIAYQSYLPMIVPTGDLLAGNGKLNVSESLSATAGPAVSGILARLLGIAGAVLVDAVTFVVSLATLAAIRGQDPARPPDPAGPADTRFVEQVGAGIGYVFRHPVLRRVAACVITANAFASIYNSVEIFYLVRTLHASTTELGVILSIGCVGGVVGGLCVNAVSRRWGRTSLLALPLIAVGWTGLLIPLARPGWGLALAAIGVAGNNAASVLFITGVAGYRQEVCPPELLSRVTASLRWMSWMTMPLGSLLGGLLAESLGLRPAVGIGVLGCWLAGLWVVTLATSPDEPVPVDEAEPAVGIGVLGCWLAGLWVVTLATSPDEPVPVDEAEPAVADVG